MTWVRFAKSKSEMAIFVKELVDKMKGKGITVKYLRCDNAGEHMAKLRKVCTEEGIEMEYTAPGEPRQNGRVERKIAIIWQRGLTMMVTARLKKEMQCFLWAEAVNCSVFLENLMKKPGRRDPALKHWTEKDVTKWFNCLVQFGRIGYIAKKDKIKTKMGMKGYPAMMVGYSQESAPGTYRFYNLESKQVVKSRDVKWHEFTAVDATNNEAIFDGTPGIQAEEDEGRIAMPSAEIGDESTENERIIPPPVDEIIIDDMSDNDDGAVEQNTAPAATVRATQVAGSSTRPRSSRIIKPTARMTQIPTGRGSILRNSNINNDVHVMTNRVVTGDTEPHRIGIQDDDEVEANRTRVKDKGENENSDLAHVVEICDPEEVFNNDVFDCAMTDQIWIKENLEEILELYSITADGDVEDNENNGRDDYNTPNTIEEALRGPEKKFCDGLVVRK